MKKKTVKKTVTKKTTEKNSPATKKSAKSKPQKNNASKNAAMPKPATRTATPKKPATNSGPAAQKTVKSKPQKKSISKNATMPKPATRKAVPKKTAGTAMSTKAKSTAKTPSKSAAKPKKESSAHLINPLHQYYAGSYPKQLQKYPGIQQQMKPVPDCGEKSYTGHGRLQGRKMLITGGDSGIGRAAAIAYSREGADIAVNYLPQEQKDAEDLARILRQEGGKVILIPGDLSNESFCRDMVKKAHKELGGLDNLTLVAGKQAAQKDIMKITTEQLENTFRINVLSLFWTVQEALPLMPPGSTIVTTSSIQAYEPSETLVDYAATKSAILAFTRGLAKQIAKKGIRANCVGPGPIWTALQISGGQTPEKVRDFGHDTPLMRAGQPVELSGVYVFLASNESSYVTAEIYGITGGHHLG